MWYHEHSRSESPTFLIAKVGLFEHGGARRRRASVPQRLPLYEVTEVGSEVVQHPEKGSHRVQVDTQDFPLHLAAYATSSI